MRRRVTDRSRNHHGLARCAYLRYLQYHSGPNGYGISRRAESMPLATGTQVHDILRQILVTPYEQVNRGVVRLIIENGVNAYDKLLEERGFADLPPGSDQDFVRKEQMALIAALSWGWFRVAFDYFHETYEVVRVEREETFVVGCDCGLGDGVGEPEDHDAREGQGSLTCNGIVIQSRPDAIVLRRQTGRKANLDFKTTAYEPYVEDWIDSVQMAFGGLGAERSLGEEIGDYDLHFLLKGARKREKDEDTGQETGPKRQRTPLIYGWCRPGAPPMIEEDWQASYYYWSLEPSKWQAKKQPGPRGYRRRLTDEYKQRPVWERKVDRPIEQWVMDDLPVETVQDSFRVLGPFQRPTSLMKDAEGGVLQQVVAYEREVLGKLWRIQEEGADPRVLFPQSWNCHPYGKDHPCPMKPICFNPTIGADPIGSGMYVPRRPHHQLELEQMQERGLEIPEEVAVEEDE